MLSRIAESMFWIGRYVERAEATARILDVHYHLVVQDALVDEPAACAALMSVMGARGAVTGTVTIDAINEVLAYSSDHPSSIASTLYAARENARGAREAISSEMWETLNGTHHALQSRVATARSLGPNTFFRYIKERAAMIGGLVDSTLVRDDGYRFLVLGRALERVDMTARLAHRPLDRRGHARRLGHHAAVLFGARGLPADVPARRRRQPGCRVPVARPLVPALGAVLARRG